MTHSEESETDLATQTVTDEKIDQALLDEARRQLGGVSSSAAVGAALQHLVDQERDRRGRAYDNVQRMVAEGLLDLDAIEQLDR